MKILQVSLIVGAMAFALSGCQSATVSRQEPINTDPETEREVVEEDNQEGKMQAMGESFYDGGYVNVRGYAEETEVDEAWCEEDCKKYQYVAFYVVPSEYDNASLQKFLDSNGGNSYVGTSSIGLGCNEDGVIVYENDSDEFGYENFELSEEVSSAILESSEDNPIDLQLVKKPLSGGRGAGTCYSHFTEMTLL